MSGEKPADWNDAYVWPQPDDPADPAPGAEEFEVIGETSVDGHMPGTTFKAVMSEERKALLVGSHLRIVPPPTTVDELQEKASELGVEGRSTMKKAELEKAVTKAQQKKE